MKYKKKTTEKDSSDMPKVIRTGLASQAQPRFGRRSAPFASPRWSGDEGQPLQRYLSILRLRTALRRHRPQPLVLPTPLKMVFWRSKANNEMLEELRRDIEDLDPARTEGALLKNETGRLLSECGDSGATDAGGSTSPTANPDAAAKPRRTCCISNPTLLFSTG